MFESRLGGLTVSMKNSVLFFVAICAIIRLIRIMCIILQVTALLATLELQDSQAARHKGHFGTPSTVVFRGFTAISFLRKRFMQVIAWIS